MKPKERIYILDLIGRELQSRWTYRDINTYLAQWHIDLSKPTTDGGMSKYIYVKELLQEEPDDTLLSIADDLDIQHDIVQTRPYDIPESKAWKPNHLRLFLSHIASFKVTTARLQNALRPYGISAFVAHEDIEPTAEWQTEIEKALFSMDAMIAILTPGFKESNWTDQEVGFALGRDVLVIPIRRDLDPYGFISKFQALQGHGATIADVADAIFEILARHPKSNTRYLRCLVDLFLVSSTEDEALHWLGFLSRFEQPNQAELERLRENAQEKQLVIDSSEIGDKLNHLLKKNGLQKLVATTTEDILDDDIPF